jgi:protocatechuate 3,4-dioxygenase beta subunit
MRAVLLSVLSLGFLASGRAQEPAAPAAKVTLRGRVVTWQGEPIAGACLAIAPADGFDTRALLREAAAKSGADGTFTIGVARPPKDGKDVVEQVLHVAAPGRSSRALPLALQPQDGTLPAEQDLGEVVLGDGSRLLGRVRTAEGRPVAGARVVATDLLERAPFQAGESSATACATVTGQDGIFDLPCAVGQAAVVECTADGFFRRRLQPVAAGTPLEIDLQTSGFIAGRVLDAEGHGVEGAQVAVSYELYNDALPIVRTGKDGRFRCSRAASGRYRVRTWLEQKEPHQQGQAATSAVGKDANETLELRLETPAATDDKPAFLRVRAVDKATGQPVPEFAAASLFEEFANQSPMYLDQQLQERMRIPVQAKDGEAHVPGPRQGEPPSGAVRVSAKGYALATREKVEWQAPGDGEAEPAVTVELLPEATVAGRVVDEATGAALPGVRVWCVQQIMPTPGADFAPGMPPDAAVTAADGTFVLKNLGQGSVDLHAQMAGRPPLPPTDLQLGSAEQRTGVELKLPAGTNVTVRIAGMPEVAAGRVLLVPLPSGQAGQIMYQDFASGMVTTDEPMMVQAGPSQFSARADGKGSYRFTGVPPGHYMAMAELPTEPRTGERIQVQVEPFRVRRADLERELDGGEDRPGIVTGKVTFARAALPFERLLVALHPCSAGPEHPFAVNPGNRRALLARDGSFRLRAAPGRYRLRVVDLTTGLELWSMQRPLELKSGGELSVNATPLLARVRVKLAPAEEEQGTAVCRLEVRFVPPAMRAGSFWQGNEQWDCGRGLELQPGQTEAELFVPAGLLIVLARGNAANLVTQGDSDAQRQPLGRAEVEIAAEPADAQLRLEVAPPPEIPEPPGK